ncbi:hypothetical protein COCVIDRAFT_29175 [Bipolaris victoriae FI3]|uniref:Uncharacterized protein n=2 Tax=Bipolaris TaxID=33194 RepID=W6Y6N3_COCC2|nr:uncharacterized protein COCCADRAFT_10292 [Bipolaris zeicola 26-R-13]XP_014553603.1 hypothetical protein COCVIDRAFT_29175 [Bipolaris victoriae FI3]EUC26966.1 hypothetical protein COCCADRAFT_10292 [Bipolaris zeicola 26-R-13]
MEKYDEKKSQMLQYKIFRGHFHGTVGTSTVEVDQRYSKIGHGKSGTGIES